MFGVLIYGTGSPVLVDIEESLFRAAVPIVGAVQNRPGECYLTDKNLLVDEAGSAQLLGIPFIIPLFTPGHRKVALAEAKAKGYVTPFSLIDPTAIVPKAVRIGLGTYINAGCTLGAASEFGAFTFINRGGAVGHHFKCGEFTSIGPGAVIGGQVTLGRGAFVGAGAVLLPKVTVGDNAVVGAGAVVTKDVPAHCLVVGNPARVVKENIAGCNGLGV